MKILTILGTRPEAIKLAPVILELQKYSDVFQNQVCVTAQHREMLDQVLSWFGIIPDYDLDLMEKNQGLAQFASRALVGVSQVLEKEQPNLVLVQGDTTTVMMAALAAFYHRIPIGHVEAGLRSNNIYSPFPEEVNRRVAGLLSRYHFAPTETARQALIGEGVDEARIFMTGNPVIDALNMIVNQPKPLAVKKLLDKVGLDGRDRARKLILVTAHRRENFGEPLEHICVGLKALTERNKNVVIIYPVHLNPNVREPVERILGKTKRIFLIDPLEYDVMAHLMNESYLLLTDSGGIQEEAPSLGKPVLVMRTETERPEGIEAGTAKLIGPNTEKIVFETEKLLRNEQLYREMATAVNPYGDGRAAERIVDVLLKVRS